MTRDPVPGAELLGAYPCLTYHDLPAALAWLRAAFGVEGELLAAPDEATPRHALLRAGDAVILVESERPDELHGPHRGQGWLYVAVADADEHYRRAGAAGAALLGPPHDFGEQRRGYSARDLEGNLWAFGTARP